MTACRGWQLPSWRSGFLGPVEEHDVAGARLAARLKVAGELGDDIKPASGGSGCQSVGERHFDGMATGNPLRGVRKPLGLPLVVAPRRLERVGPRRSRASPGHSGLRSDFARAGGQESRISDRWFGELAVTFRFDALRHVHQSYIPDRRAIITAFFKVFAAHGLRTFNP